MRYHRYAGDLLRAPFLFCQAALPHLSAARGAILNIGRARLDLPPEALILPEEIAELAVFLLTRRTAVIDEIEVHRPNPLPEALRNQGFPPV